MPCCRNGRTPLSAALDYCRAKVAPPGSALHYILLLTDDAARAPLLALHCCYRQLRDCIDQLKEPAIAQAKLDWWRLEFERLLAGSPQHPATQLLLPSLADVKLDPAGFQQWVDTALSQLQYDVFPDPSSLDLFCRQQQGLLFRLSAPLLGRVDAETLQSLQRLGGLLQQLEQLQNLPTDLAHGRLYLPLSELDASGLTPDQLQSPTPEQQLAIQQLLTRIGTDLATQIQQLEAGIAPISRLALYPLLAQSQLGLRALRLASQTGFRPTRQPPWPLPLLWHCWRLKQREQRHASRTP